MPVVYLTTNKINGKKYIGADSRDDPSYLGSGLRLKSAIKKYGSTQFYKTILEECNSVEEMYDREKYWIKHYNAVYDETYYNLCDGGMGGNKLTNPTSIKKHKENSMDLGEYNRMRLAGKTYDEIYGVKSSIEKLKRRDTLTGIKHTNERRKNISNSLLGNIPWNKGLTKEDPRVKKYVDKSKSHLPYKEYILYTPLNEELTFTGKKSLASFLKNINKDLPLKSRINVDLLISNGETKGYKIKHTTIKRI